jgi:hypothetical protein
MAAQRFNLSIEQGATFKKRFIWRDKNGRPFRLADWSALMQIRPAVGSSTLIYQLSSANGKITLGNNGVVELTIPSVDTETITAGVYDLLMIAPDTVTEVRLIEGRVAVVPGVTQN